MTLPVLPKTLITSQIEDIINNSTGRDVSIFYVYSTYACPDPTDSLDPITNLSTNSFCQTCSGNYWIDTISGVVWSGHVTWRYDYKNEFETGGRVFIGDVQAKFILTEERENILKTPRTYLVIDDITTDIVKLTKLGNPPNRIIVSCKEREE
jgi:hypothetical protein